MTITRADMCTEEGSTLAVLECLRTALDKPDLPPGPRLAHLARNGIYEVLSSGEKEIVQLALDVWTGRTSGVLHRLGAMNRGDAVQVLCALACRLGVDNELGLVLLRPEGAPVTDVEDSDG